MSPEQRESTSALAAGAWGLDRVPAIQRYRFVLEAHDPIVLPEYEGSALRGLLGHGLKRTVCVTRARACDGCLLLRSCPYPAVFETPAPPAGDAPQRTSHVPHPFVLGVDPAQPRRLETGDRFHFELTLIGEADRQLPYLIHAVSTAGERGIGARRQRFGIQRVDQETGLGSDDWRQAFDPVSATLDLAPVPDPVIAEPPPLLEIRLDTPLRLKRKGRLVTPADFGLPLLLHALRDRLFDLQALYGQRPAATPRAWIDETTLEVPALATDLAWRDWTRYSSRQDALMQLGGLVGRIWVGGESVARLWPLLWLGQWVHAGKATSMGLGRYRTAAAASLP